jgi:ribosomal protein S18 acetylase RimI-like enzyme
MTPPDYRVVDEVLAEAFSADPLSRMLFGRRNPRPGILRMNRSTVRHKHGRGRLAEVDGQIVGALLEADSPKCEPEGLLSTVDMLRAVRFQLVSALSVFREAARAHPTWPHRHLSVLGVLPAFQRKGVGSRMLAEFCSRADEDGVAGYLETDTADAAHLYERFGFRVVQRRKVKGSDFMFMWRQPATAPDA